MDTRELIPHLFRTEYRKIVSVLCRRFGFDEMEVAEDIAAETFLTASQAWGINGTPENPAGWLYHVAKNKAKNYLQKKTVFENNVAPEVVRNSADQFEPDLDLSSRNIEDSQLQMMFAICHPSLHAEAQIGLSLRILCGFGIEEIADAFLVSRETINKRLFRAKEKLRTEGIRIELPSPPEIERRLDSVLKTIYLLFNEGYYSMSQNTTLRKDLCFEAMRLCIMLVENMQTNKPRVNALLALMCFHTSRFDARTDQDGELIIYQEQDSSLWNDDLISKGGYFLKCSAEGNMVSKYHLEAGIAFWNTQKEDHSIKWESMLKLYDQLIALQSSPIAALNRIFAFSKVHGRQAAIEEAEKLNLHSSHFYFALLGELHSELDHFKARQNFKKAAELAKTDTQKAALLRRIERLQ